MSSSTSLLLFIVLHKVSIHVYDETSQVGDIQIKQNYRWVLSCGGGKRLCSSLRTEILLLHFSVINYECSSFACARNASTTPG